jgi:hypothetical protein
MDYFFGFFDDDTVMTAINNVEIVSENVTSINYNREE